MVSKVKEEIKQTKCSKKSNDWNFQLVQMDTISKFLYYLCWWPLIIVDDYKVAYCFVQNFPAMPEVKYNWKDITEDFVHCTSDLKLGELLHDAK